jgi:Fe-S cluster biosynthesis and repair protein YggX
MVQCVKFGRELPGLAAPPFPGPLGQRIFEEVSQQAWNLWPQQATILINHYGMSLADPQAQQVLLQAMEEFFFGQDAQMPEGWAPPVAAGKGGARRK